MIKKKLLAIEEMNNTALLLLSLVNERGQEEKLPIKKIKLKKSGWKIGEYMYVRRARSKNKRAAYIYEVTDFDDRFYTDGKPDYHHNKITWWKISEEDQL